MTAKKVTFSITLDSSAQSSLKLENICKVAIFGITCKTKPFTITEDSWTPSATTIDLLSGASTQITLPTLTITPDSCYTTTWTVYKTSDNTDMMATYSTVFTISATPELVV